MTLEQIITPLVYILIGLIAYKLIKILVKNGHKFGKSKENKKRDTIENLIVNVIKYLIVVIVALKILNVFGINTDTILASLGIAGVVIGLALQDLIKDLVAGVAIVFDDEYNVGDIITINDFKGEVVSFGLKSTKIKKVNGDILCIPNGQITQVINHSVGYSLAVVDVDIAYEEEISKALKVLAKVAKDYANTDKLVGPIEVLGVTNLGTNGITIRITAKTKSEEQYKIERMLRQAVKEAFDKEHITIPYPQLVVHHD